MSDDDKWGIAGLVWLVLMGISAGIWSSVGAPFWLAMLLTVTIPTLIIGYVMWHIT